MQNEGKIAILDVSSYIFRAFHALPPMPSPDGRPVNAIYGFINMFLRTMSKFKGFAAVAALDSKTETFRKKAYPEYKANRKEVDPDLKSQFELITPMLEALNIPVFASDGFEADDIIASIVANNPDKEIIIISSDKDLMQLVGGNVLMYDSMKDKVIDPAAVQEKYGVMPAQMLDFLALLGDSSDNVPGMPKVGLKTAAELLNKYGSADNIYQNLSALKPALQKGFTENKEQFEFSKFLIKLDSSVKLDGCKKCFDPWENPDTEKIVKLCSELGFASILKKIGSDSSAKKEPAPEPKKTIELHEKWEAGEFDVKSGETLYGSTFYGSFYVAKEGRFMPLGIADLPQDSTVYSFEVKEFLDAPFPKGIKFIDLQIYYFCHDSGRHGYSPEEIAEALGLGEVSKDSPEQWFAFLEKLRAKIEEKHEDKSFLLNGIEMPHLEVVRAMEQNGIKVDLDETNRLRTEFLSKINDLTKQIYEAAGTVFNPNSPKQLAEMLFDKLQLKGGKKTKTGYSTGHEVLENVAEENDHPLPKLIIENRKYSKLVSTYLEPIAAKTASDGRLHTSYIVTYAATGRLASREPNLQNIPTRTEDGQKIRGLFVAEKGFKLLSLDYSQIELRILAALSKEPEFIDAFKNGEDIHRRTAAAIFGTLPEFVDKEMRRNAKAVNFGIIYGMQAYKLSVDTGVDIAFAKKYIDNYFACYPKIKQFIDGTIREARENGYVETFYGRRRYIPEIANTNKNIAKSGERMAVNTVIQGTAADVIKQGTVLVYKMLQEECPEARILLQIHDELIIEIPENRLDIAEKCAEKMREAGKDFEVPLDVNYSVGGNWAELK
jgi:DNA polymerase-1